MLRHFLFFCSCLLLASGCDLLDSSSPLKASQNQKSLSSLEELSNEDLSIKPRIVVLTDFGADPDDEQSMVRFLLYANEFDIEGLLVTSTGFDGDERKLQNDLLIKYLDGYEAVQANLTSHVEGYPNAKELKALVKPDKWMLHKKAEVGSEHQTIASQHIISVVDKEDSRPVWFVIWGGPRPLSQALWEVRQGRSREQYQEFLAKIRIYSISKQDSTFDWLEQNAASAFTIVSASGKPLEEGFRGMYLTGDTVTTTDKWIKKNIIDNHSPLGAIYPLKAAKKLPGIKEGDTPSFFYLLSQRIGLSNSNFPNQGGWGGRFLPTQNAWYSEKNALDLLDDNWDRRHSVARWRDDYNRDFAARMDWTTTSEFDQVNHPPEVRVKIGSKNKLTVRENLNLFNQIIIAAEANETIPLNAVDSSDPDGDKLNYDWFYYAEAGNYDGEIIVNNNTQADASITLPADWQQGDRIHIVLRVTDSGSPPLTRYRRIIIGATEVAATNLKPRQQSSLTK